MSLFADALEPETLYAHCDGGSRGNPGPSGFGAVIADSRGRTVAELSEFLGIRTNNYAEYSGLLAVLGWAIQHGHRRLKVISDSELMVKQIQGRYKVHSPDLKPLWQEARNRIAKLEGFEISHALRHKNKEADALANQAMDRGMRQGRDSATGPGINRATDSGSRSSPAPVDSLPLRTRPLAAPAPATRTFAPEPSPRVPVTERIDSAAPGSATRPKEGTMLRGFTRGGSVHLLGDAKLPDGILVKVIVE